MEYRLEALREHVYELLDENREIIEERVEYFDPGASIGVLIDRFLLSAARAAVQEVSLSEIMETTRIVPSASPDRVAGYMAVMEMPTDFLRLVYFRMVDWEEGVTEALEYGSMASQLRRRAGPYGYRMNRPGVALQRRGAKWLMMIYGSSPGSKAAELEYVPEPKLKEGTIEFPSGLEEEVCGRVAAQIKTIIGA